MYNTYKNDVIDKNVYGDILQSPLQNPMVVLCS